MVIFCATELFTLSGDKNINKSALSKVKKSQKVKSVLCSAHKHTAYGLLNRQLARLSGSFADNAASVTVQIS